MRTKSKTPKPSVTNEVIRHPLFAEAQSLLLAKKREPLLATAEHFLELVDFHKRQVENSLACAQEQLDKAMARSQQLQKARTQLFVDGDIVAYAQALYPPESTEDVTSFLNNFYELITS